MDPDSYISFRYARFEKQEKVVFDGCIMERVSFIGTGIERVKFRNVKWRDFKIYDEKLLLLKVSEKERKKFVNECGTKDGEAKTKIEEALNRVKDEIDLTLDNVLAVYRALRENHDYYLKYDESGKFFINEMKLRKRFSKFGEKIVMSAYELFCLYGESFSRTILWMLATIPLFAIVRLNFGGFPPVLSMDSLMDSLRISTAVFFQLYHNNDWVTILERLLSITILGVFYIALKRKLERRIRH